MLETDVDLSRPFGFSLSSRIPAFERLGVELLRDVDLL
jgi:hypothetical protein